MPGTILVTGDIVINKIDKISSCSSSGVERAWGRQTNIINAKLCEILVQGCMSKETIEDYNGISSDGRRCNFK